MVTYNIMFSGFCSATEMELTVQRHRQTSHRIAVVFNYRLLVKIISRYDSTQMTELNGQYYTRLVL